MGIRRRLAGLRGLVILAAIPTMLDPYDLLGAYPALALGVFAALTWSLSGGRAIGARYDCPLAAVTVLLFVLSAIAKKVGLGPEFAALCQAAPYAISGFVASSLLLAQSGSDIDSGAPRLVRCLALCASGLVMPLGSIAGYGIAATDLFAFVGPMPKTWAVVAPWLVLSLAGCAISVARLLETRKRRFAAAACMQFVTFIQLISFIAYGNNLLIGRAVSLCSIAVFACEVFADDGDAPGCRESEAALIALAVGLCLTAVFLAANELPGMGLYPFVGQANPSSSFVWALVALCVMAQMAPLVPRKAGHEPATTSGEAPKAIAHIDGLSPRESEVLNCLARGLTVAQTSADLSISPGSVGTYRSRIYKKLGVRSAQELRAKTARSTAGENGRVHGAPQIDASRQPCPWTTLLLCGALVLAAYLGLPSLTMAAERTGLDGMRLLVAAGAMIGLLIDASSLGLSRRAARLLAISMGVAGLPFCLLVEGLQYPVVAAGLDHTWSLPLSAGVMLGFAAGNFTGHKGKEANAAFEGPAYLMLGALGAAFFLARAAEASAYLAGWAGRICGAMVLAGALGTFQHQVPNGMHIWPKLLLACGLAGMLLGEGLLSAAIAPLSWGSLAINGTVGAILATWTAVANREFRLAHEALQNDVGKQSVQDLMNSLALSPAERRVCELLLEGMSVPGIAERLVVSRNTVAAQKKSVYRKAGVHSQATLIELFLGSCGLESPARR